MLLLRLWVEATVKDISHTNSLRRAGYVSFPVRKGSSFFTVKVSERPLCNVYINVNWADSKNRKLCFYLRYHVFHGWLPLTIIMGVIKFLSYMYSWCSVFKISVWQWKNDCRYQFLIRNRTGFYKNMESQTQKRQADSWFWRAEQ